MLLTLPPIVAAAAGCSMAAGEVSGIYRLVTFNDRPLPAVVTTSATTESRSSVEVLSWELALDEAGDFVGRAVFRRTTDGQASLDTMSSSGIHHREANRVELRSSTGEVRTLLIGEDGDKLTSSPSPGDSIHGVARLDVLVFRRGL